MVVEILKQVNLSSMNSFTTLYHLCQWVLEFNSCQTRGVLIKTLKSSLRLKTWPIENLRTNSLIRWLQMYLREIITISHIELQVSTGYLAILIKVILRIWKRRLIWLISRLKKLAKLKRREVDLLLVTFRPDFNLWIKKLTLIWQARRLSCSCPSSWLILTEATATLSLQDIIM